jgi:hypothetical protein
MLFQDDKEINTNEYAAQLVQAANEKSLFDDDRLFFTYMKTVHVTKLKDILELFLKVV